MIVLNSKEVLKRMVQLRFSKVHMAEKLGVTRQDLDYILKKGSVKRVDEIALILEVDPNQLIRSVIHRRNGGIPPHAHARYGAVAKR